MTEHRVQYYETDRMGITHHSNYIRWMEEARIAYLEENGFSYAYLESCGIISPVLSVDGAYKKSTTFPDRIRIEVFVESYKGLRLKLYYTMINDAGETVFTGHSEHCFLDLNGRPVRLSRVQEPFHAFLQAEAERYAMKEGALV